MTQKFGVHSEVGKLRTVLVCRPGLAHQRLTPGNAAELLFDDVLWVQEAQKDHYDFVLKMRERGVEVLELRRTHDRRRDGVLPQQPGEGNLRRSGFLLFCDLDKQINHDLICFYIFS